MPRFLLIPIFLFTVALLPAQIAVPQPDSHAVLFAAEESHNWEDYALMGLWASMTGSSDATQKALDDQLARINAAAAELLASPELPSNPRECGEYVLGFMHKKFLKSYSTLQTRLDTLLSNGRYNCVSSAVLYLIMAEAVGLEVQGVMTKDHAFARLRAGNEWIDIETTNPYGFDPGNRKEFQDEFGKTTGFAYVPARNYRDRTNISPLELVSLILHNRIAELESKNRYAEAVPLAVNRAQLLRGRKGVASADSLFADPEKDLLDRVFNYGASLLKSGKEQEVLRWAAAAEPHFPSSRRWEELTAAAANNLIVKQIRGNKFADARNTLAAAAPLLTSENRVPLAGMIADGELSARSRAMKEAAEAEGLLNEVAAAGAEGLLSQERAAELRTFIISKGGNFFAAKKDWSGGIAFIEAAAARWGSSKTIQSNLDVLRENRLSEIHNAFAAAFNKKNFAEAERIIEAGLKEFPANRQLLQDRGALDKAGG